uniref:EOG090X0GPB n=1 Tax=Daphnia longispina TaxID=42846 RepID=A0A4Y7M5E1_9CRUS|nr:EOG090X0GPB [Daphnia longispina]
MLKLLRQKKCFLKIGMLMLYMNYHISFPDPFAVGGGDLNPLGRGLGGGGMLMDPRHMGRQPPLGIPGNLPPGRLYALKQGFILKRVEEDLSFLLDLMEVLSNNKKELQSKLEVTDIPVARAHVEGVVQKLLNWAENAPPLVSFTNVVTKAFHSAGMLLDVCNIFGEPSEDHQAEKAKYTDTHGANLDGEFDSKTSKSTAREINIPHSNVGGLSENLAGIISEELGNAESKKTGSLSLSIRTTTSNGENRKSLNVAKENGRLHALQTGLSIKKDKEDLTFLFALMDWLEKTKQEMKSNETVSDEIVAQAHMENVAVKLFNWADTEDRHKRYNKNVVKAFYSAGMLFDVCAVFGELNEDVAQQKKYSKWRAAHLHNCLNSGEAPTEPAPKPDDQMINDSENLEYGFSSDVKPVEPTGHSHAYDVVRPSIPVPTKPATPPSSVPTYVQESSSVLVTPEQIVQAQKHCKYASSALTYEDVPTAIDNLQKALRVLQAGQQS